MAFSDGIERVILIPAKVKRICQQELRVRGVKPSMIVLRMFAAGILLLLDGHLERIGSVTIDTEYEGKEGEIKDLLLRFIFKWVPDFPQNGITFHRVGKQSGAHILAWETHKRRRKPDKRITAEELLQYC